MGSASTAWPSASMITMPFFIRRTSDWKRFLYHQTGTSSLGGAGRPEVQMTAPVAGGPFASRTPIQARHAFEADHVAVNGLAAAFVEVIACFMIAQETAGEDSMDGPEIGLEGFSPRAQWSRRGFVMTSLVTGFALSVRPVSAQTITTDTNGLEAGEVKVPVKDGTIPAYRAMPAAGGAFPSVLVVQEVFGVHEHIKDICRRLAKLGYYAVAPELFARATDTEMLTTIEEGRAAAAKTSDRQVMSDLDATTAFA